MNKRTILTLAATLAATALTTAVTLNARGESPTTAPASAKPDVATIKAGLEADQAAFQSAFTSAEVLIDPAARKAAAPKVVPAARKMYDDYAALAVAEPESKERAEATAGQMTTILALYGDADAKARMQARADSKDAATATDGKGDQLLVQWWLASKDADAQGKLADAAETLAKAHPEHESLTGTLMAMSQMGPATPDLGKRLQALVVDVMKNPVAEQMKPQIAAEAKLAALEGKPMTITGKTVDGKPFTTADWKGKVILVDHWATWCGPCKAELPRVEKIYADYHAKGLEILGVSNDQSADDLTAFVKADPKMPWPQLFDQAAADKGSWNPITTNFGINGIPTMFLIDKNGVCRTVEAREKMEDLIPKMLDEK